MARARPRLSLFSYTAERGTSVAYFLGAVVPLVALAIGVERYGPPTRGVPADPYSVNALTLIASIALLSLSSFFLLRSLVRRSSAEIRSLAYYDVLTGLPNRRMYADRLGQALLHARQTDTLAAICHLDLHGFKRINDTMGHSYGDQLLREVGERLVGGVRLGDSVARPDQNEAKAGVSRLGGDEFTFLLTGISDAQDAGRVARRVLAALSEPFMLGPREVFVTTSIGIAIYPLDGDDAEALMKNANTAMYWAKVRERNNYQFYSSDMNEVAVRKLELESCLRRALERGDLVLHYQPVRDAVSGRLSGAEALLRWNDAEHGAVAPSEFIPIAEDTGLILPIGAWALRTACVQAHGWQTAGFSPIRMAVNVSGHQLRQPMFVKTVARILRESGLSAAYLDLEITESTIMQDDEVTNTTFRELDEMGVGIVLDDFGTGYSSLSYLKRFPIGRVKIDRSFVAGIGESSEGELAAAIIAMAHGLRLGVVAEGVETSEQMEFLREKHCDELQGFLFSPAVPAEEFARFLRREKVE